MAAAGPGLARAQGSAPRPVAPRPVAPKPVAPKPVQIGCLVALSGPLEVIGRPILDGADIAADQLNQAGGILGRPVQIVPFDTRGDPDAAQRGMQQLTKAGINLLCGIVSSTEALALAPALQPADAVLVTCAAAAERLTHEAFTPHLFRVTDQTFMRNRAQAQLMASRYPGVRRWGAIVPDVEYGASAYASFRDGLQEAYPAQAGRMPELGEPVVARSGATDFSQQVAALREQGTDGLFIAVYGDDAISFYRQAAQAGLMRQVGVVADAVNEFLVPLSLGAACPEHLWLGMTWYYGGYQDQPLGRQLYHDYVRSTGNALPLGFVETGHAAVLAYAAGIRQARTTDTRPVIAAMEGLTFGTAKGPATFRREDHQAVCDVNFVRIRSDAEEGLGILDHARSDVEVAEFVRYDGAGVIEPPSPGQRIAYRSAG